MSQDSLTARYRPQTFAQVAGQNSVKSILSRAAALGRVAPAYLFSGTRGVGKTTLARIFAKALNCLNGPAAEPCNTCSMCRQITLGAAVDVLEIDGASNNGVDNVRNLKEDVGYAPLDGRYKVIIIDEAHMLSKAAFNALLKTLEEPPGHVTFIMATTEPEKFPQTIISRCQHFVFKRLPQADLAAHLRMILEQEEIIAEPAAINVLARRGAGSVRDSMSLLAQVLALGGETLTMQAVREVLGLAGQDVFLRLLGYVEARDLLALHGLMTEMLDQGVDLGFFLRELAACWRNIFLLLQLGEGATAVIDLPTEEVAALRQCALTFTPAHVHAAWQLTLDSQQRIVKSMEPTLALELLLYNLASLPDLLAVGAPGNRAQENQRSTPAASRMSAPVGPSTQPGATGVGRPAPIQSAAHAAPTSNAVSRPAPVRPPAAPARAEQGVESAVPPASEAPVPRHESPAMQSAPRPAPGSTSRPLPSAPVAQDAAVDPAIPRTWPEFVKFCTRPPAPRKPVPMLDKVSGEVGGEELVLSSPHPYLCERLNHSLTAITDAARAFFGPRMRVRIAEPRQEPRKTRTQLREDAAQDPVVREAQEHFQARIMEVRPFSPATPKENEI